MELGNSNNKVYNYKSIFYRKTEIEKVIRGYYKMSQYLINDIYQLQNSIQSDLTDNSKVLSRNFIIEEDDMTTNANIIETSLKGKNKLKS